MSFHKEGTFLWNTLWWLRSWASYAYDFTAVESSSYIHLAAEELSVHPDYALSWADNKKLTISVDKSHPTILTSDTHQYRIDTGVTMGHCNLDPERNPKILGVYFNPLFTFSHNVMPIHSWASFRNHILKALAGTNWGQEKETLLITYRALIR